MDPIYVIGHRNPDTDAICAAIGYAAYLREVRGGEVVAVAGDQRHAHAGQRLGGLQRPDGDIEAISAGATNASYGTSLPPTLTVPTRSPRPARMLSR